jgi:alkaline phosphatase D
MEIPTSGRGQRRYTRRDFAIGSGLIMAGAWFVPQTRSQAAPGKPFGGVYPFKLGIASGDPTPTGVVLWTRLAPKPLVAGGGMPAEQFEVPFVVASDEAMTKVVASGKAVAGPEWAHSVHVEVEGLQPDTWYWYQFQFGDQFSPKGRTRTLPARDSMPEKLKFAFVSCQHYEWGYYTAFDHLVKESPELVVHLGDYIYEKGVTEGRTRRHNSRTCKTLDDYRARYGLYKSDPSLQRAHEIAPWIVTWDDHEVANNYAGLVPKAAVPTREFLRRRAAAYQAYFEHMPLRRASLPSGSDMLLYRGFEFGRLASFSILDTRQYRTIQPMGDGFKAPSAESLSTKATILGERQRTWLFGRLSKTNALWNVIAQQVMVAAVDFKSGPGIEYPMDKWTGYENDRRLLIRHLQSAKPANPVIITGDIHTHWANEIVNNFDGDTPVPVAVELVGSSISSEGDGDPERERSEEILRENPFVKFRDKRRGYVMCELDRNEWRADFRVVPYVTRRGAPLLTVASFVIKSGSPKLLRA